MKKANQVLFGLGCAGAVAGMVAIGGCKSYEDYRNERAEYAIKHFESAKYRDMMEGEKVNLTQCIKLALEHNLDMKVLNLEQEVAREMRTADMLGMLPELNISDTYTNRSNVPASKSEKVDEGGLSYGYSTSQNRGSASAHTPDTPWSSRKNGRTGSPRRVSGRGRQGGWSSASGMRRTAGVRSPA